MKLTGIHIDHYGHYEQLSITKEAFSHPLTVIYGPNETGKSTLHSFIRSVLFGFVERGIDPYQPLQGGHMGGTLHFVHEGRPVRISRHTPPKKGQIAVQIDGRQASEHELRALLGHISPVLFEAIFAFSHQDLGRLENLQTDEINSYLYSAAMGTRGIDLFRLEQELNKRRDEWFRPRATKPKINQLLLSLAQEEKEIQTLKNRMKAYTPLREDVKQMETDLEGLRQERKRLEREQRELEALEKAQQVKEDMHHLERQIERMPPFCFLPHEERFQTLLMQKTIVAEKVEEERQLKAQLADKADRIDQRVRLLGPEWRLERIMELDLSLRVQDQLLEQAARLEEIENEYRRVESRREEEEQKVNRLTAVWQQEKEALEEQLQQRWEQNKAQHRSSSPREWLIGCLITLALPVAIWVVFDSPAVAVLTLSGLVAMLFLGYQQQRKRYALTKRVVSAVEDQLEHIYRNSDRYLKQMGHELAVAQDQLAYLEEKKARLERQAQQSHQEWTAWLVRLGWPHSLSAERVPDLLKKLEEIQQEQRQMERIKERLQQIQEEVADWEEKVRELARAVDHSIEDITPVMWLDMIAEKIEQEKEKEQAKEKLLINLEQSQRQYEQVALSLNISVSQLDERLQALSEQQIEERLSATKMKLEANLKHIEALATKMGQMQSKLRELESEETLTRKVQVFEEKKARLNQMAREWAILAMAGHLCREARYQYEQERQPAVLKEASRFFSQMTLGRYTRIIAPLGQRELIAVRQDDERLPVTHLSQGTQEQLYLALRFAFIREFGRHVQLPVIMDDPFVNCDDRRLEAILQGVKELCDTHQVILFTCHDHILQRVQASFQDAGGVLQLKTDCPSYS
ncbi:uncharacterized protein YhaN [Caldalkalibacillus uzonensis]|uniref:Uncharacterized protein YhaN n=1 Tax=Caldalkalibacillus uzonensis TaxID=353224 RepID=A0ABU0CNA6_9BACI|nr:AAA family ATPase [Caldalkalibacillus uzonensis]MDQ0337897.1 uncharacterized protein YhaN [Caldalkalibacillus uzonensis]